MAEHQFSKAAAFAHKEHNSLCMELHAAGFDLNDNGEWLHSSLHGCSDQSPGIWAVSLQPDDAGHQMLVFSIHGNDEDPYGISYAVTLCGKPRSVCYWSGWEEAVIVGNDAEWPGLPAAVLKARRLRLQHAEEGNQ